MIESQVDAYDCSEFITLDNRYQALDYRPGRSTDIDLGFYIISVEITSLTYGLQTTEHVHVAIKDSCDPTMPLLEDLTEDGKLVYPAFSNYLTFES